MSTNEKSKVKRTMLESDSVRQAVEHSGHAAILRSEEELSQSLKTIQKSAPKDNAIWVFGYGSLIWNPMLDYVEKRNATIHGYHRGFYLWSQINRGSPEYPGLVLALDNGGACRGVAYRLNPKSATYELTILWRREMLSRAYFPRWIRARTDQGTINAITFIIDRKSQAYTGKLTDDEIVEIASKAKGHYGSCADYLFETASSFEENKIVDKKIDHLSQKLRAKLSQNSGRT